LSPADAVVALLDNGLTKGKKMMYGQAKRLICRREPA
jgi:hypothetical protein